MWKTLNTEFSSQEEKLKYLLDKKYAFCDSADEIRENMDTYYYLNETSLKILRNLGREEELEEEVYQDFLSIRNKIKDPIHYKLVFKTAL